MSIKIQLRRFIARNMNPLVELIYSVKLKITKFNKEPIIILTPGKVGSSSVYNTLKINMKNPVYHIHRFSQSGIDKKTSDFLNSQRKSKPLHLIISKFLRKKLLNYSGDIYIVTIVREPISRIVSSFFQNTELYKEELENKNLQINRVKAQELLTTNLKNNICKEIEEWFDVEIRDNFGIDVFEKEFDNNSKYVITHHKQYHHLLLKMEDLNEVFPKAIQEFLDLDTPLSLQNTNVAEKKHYAKVYKQIKDGIKLPPQIVEEIVSSKYFQHFYNGKESEIIKKWSIKPN